MARSEIISKILSEVTPEKTEERRLKRIEATKQLTLDYQLGWYVGETLIDRKLPTLSVDSLQTLKCIKVSDEEEAEYKRLSDIWFNNYNEGEGNNDPNWIALKSYHGMLKDKYIPPTLEYHVRPLNITNIEEFKTGFRQSLWDSDVCYYNIKTNDDIEIVDTSDAYFTTIKLKYEGLES